ncbi:MAG: hypothetical protein KA954_10630 [Chitinophagales bacterium]|nr:hypothetical protein [Bacteroidota bacterium]MBP7400032.1 hypothetical protein [Chitinophagales bacterium]MBP8754177.1 hypothetical protein [Chitinophagales bacterium]MBP9549694.1 hypothetical protein [Chitinophagales bacterium]MBP9704655.1 hypothetical protein [Chitinophagales bacterium]
MKIEKLVDISTNIFLLQSVVACGVAASVNKFITDTEWIYVPCGLIAGVITYYVTQPFLKRKMNEYLEEKEEEL